MYHRIGITKALAKGFARRNLADLVLIQRIVHDHVVCEHGPAARFVADAQGVKRVKGVGAELDTGTDLANFGGLLQYLDLKALSRQSQCSCQSADAATGDQDGSCLVCALHIQSLMVKKLNQYADNKCTSLAGPCIRVYPRRRRNGPL